MNGRSGPGFFVGVVTGIAIGAALAMLLAPSTGEETRDVLRAKAREASNLAKDAVADMTDQARAFASKGAQTALDVRQTLDAAAEEARVAAAEQRATLERHRIELDRAEQE